MAAGYGGLEMFYNLLFQLQSCKELVPGTVAFNAIFLSRHIACSLRLLLYSQNAVFSLFQIPFLKVLFLLIVLYLFSFPEIGEEGRSWDYISFLQLEQIYRSFVLWIPSSWHPVLQGDKSRCILRWQFVPFPAEGMMACFPCFCHENLVEFLKLDWQLL